MTPITIPQLDANLIDVTITRWHKKVGDTITSGESVAELTTDKATYELESPADGTLLIIYAPEKSIIPAGATIAMLGNPTDIPPPQPPQDTTTTYSSPASDNTKAQGELQHSKKTTRAPRIRATPRARRLATEHNLDLAKIKEETNAEVITEATLAPYLP